MYVLKQHQIAAVEGCPPGSSPHLRLNTLTIVDCPAATGHSRRNTLASLSMSFSFPDGFPTNDSSSRHPKLQTKVHWWFAAPLRPCWKWCIHSTVLTASKGTVTLSDSRSALRSSFCDAELCYALRWLGEAFRLPLLWF